MKRICIKNNPSNQSIEEAFDGFIMGRKAMGVVDKTIETYKGDFRSIASALNMKQSVSVLKKEHSE